VHDVRTVEDATNLGNQLKCAEHVVVIGGGFIGLEVASVAAAGSVQVTVLEAGERIMARSVSAPISEHFSFLHRIAGVELLVGEGLARIEPDDARSGRPLVVTTCDRTIEADLLVTGIGVVPNDELAAAAGLEVADGVLVDAGLRTSDPDIWAIGDCARFPASPGATTRLESLQNASDQARHVARSLASETHQPYHATPWFWTEQAGSNLQIAGLLRPECQLVMRGDPNTGRFSVLHYVDDNVAAVESVNWPRDHAAARRILALGVAVPREPATDPAVDLKTFIA
jgi:3-phenylpropionate/trans-cinnamate dioxygenase ferredoxin reductase subunit